MNFDETPEFKKEFKALTKKWRSLPSDLRKAQIVIQRLYTGDQNFKEGYFNTNKAAVLTSNETYEVVKMRLDCAALGNKNLLRLVFVYIKTDNGILLVELFSKNDKNREEVLGKELIKKIRGGNQFALKVIRGKEKLSKADKILAEFIGSYSLGSKEEAIFAITDNEYAIADRVDQRKFAKWVDMLASQRGRGKVTSP